MRYRRYTREFKDEACKLGADVRIGLRQAAKRLGILEATLRLWVRDRDQLEPRPVPELPVSNDPAVLQTQVRELREQLRRSEIDKDV